MNGIGWNRPNRRTHAAAAALLGVLCASTICVRAAETQDRQQPIAGVGITERLGESLPLDATFVDETGRTVTLADYFDGRRPVLLNLAYYECPGTCTAVLSGLTAMLQQIPDPPGESFRVLTISFDPREKPQLAAGKKQSYLQMLGRPQAAEGWAFLTGDQANIDRLTQAAGFGYQWIEDSGQFAHDMALMVVTPDGRLSRYVRGAFYDPQTVRLSMVEASGGRIGSISERLTISICGYDPRYGRYVVLAGRVMSLGGAMTVLVLAVTLALLWRREQRRNSSLKIKGHAQPNPA